MALDDVLLAARAQNASPDTLRFLQFSPHCALVGYHQDVQQELRLPYCREHGIAVNRRLTGGGALYWDENQLGWEIVASRAALGHADPGRLPELICRGVILGLGKLGVRAVFRPRNDIEVDGRKVSGTGGTSLGRSILYQGSLLVDFDVNTMLRALRIPMEKLKDKEIDSVRERVTSLSNILGAAPPLAEIKCALAAGFSEALGITFATGASDRWRD